MERVTKGCFGMVRVLVAASALASGLSFAEGEADARQIIVEPVQQPLAALQTPVSDIRIGVQINRPDGLYVPGDEMKVYFTANQSGYVTILNVNAEGKTTVIFPNAASTDGRVAANKQYQIPKEAAGFLFRVTPPYGNNLIKVIATSKKISVLEASKLARGQVFDSYTGDVTSLARNIEVVITQQPALKWAQATLSFAVVPQRPGTVTGSVSVPQPAIPVQGATTVAAPTIIVQQTPGVIIGQPPVPAPAPPVVIGGNSPIVASASSPFTFRLSLDKSVFRIGEALTFNAVTDKDCTLSVMNVDAAGQVTALYPNEKDRRVRLSKGKTTFFPAADVARLSVGGPAGANKLIALCTEVENGIFFSRAVTVTDVQSTVANTKGPVAQATLDFTVTQ